MMRTRDFLSVVGRRVFFVSSVVRTPLKCSRQYDCGKARKFLILYPSCF
jgi:hypothetical protein